MRAFLSSGWLTPQPTTHATRDAEWLAAFAMVGFALALALPGNSFANPVFAVFHRLGFTEALCGTVFGAIGTMRLVALHINGRSPRTPWFRVVGAFAGMLIWTQYGVAVLIGSEQAFGNVPPTVSFFAILAAFELRSIMRASFDVRYHR